MKLEGKLFAFAAAFFLLVVIGYGYLSRDIAGIMLLTFLTAMMVVVGFYLLHASRRVFPRPEDRDDGDIDEADSDYGFYSPYSWWPLPVAASAAFIGLGFAFAAWMVVFGIVCLMLSLVGFLFEYYRGDHAH